MMFSKLSPDTYWTEEGEKLLDENNMSTTVFRTLLIFFPFFIHFLV